MSGWPLGDSLTVRFVKGIAGVLLEEVLGVEGVNAPQHGKMGIEGVNAPTHGKVGVEGVNAPPTMGRF